MAPITCQVSSPQLNIIVIPYVTPGHLVPLCEIACLFATRGVNVTIIATPDKTAVVGKTINKCISSGHPITVHTIPFPWKDVGLPYGFSLEQAKDIETATKYYNGLCLMKPAMQDFILTRHPDCIIADNFFPWTTDFAATLNIPRFVFDPCSIFSKALHEAIRNPNSPHLSVESDYDPFVLSDLPNPITLTRSKLRDESFAMLANVHRAAELKSYGIIINSMSELDSDYSKYYAKKLGYKAFHVGPAFLIHQNANDKVERSHKSVVSEEEVLSWLNSKKPNSVLYISFGTGCTFPDEQLMEIACALDSANCNFIWVVQGKNINDNDEDTWLPKGFREKGNGMIIKGWAPQLLILDHSSTAGLMTNCGWNSIMEAIIAGVPLVTWPLICDNFCNEMFVTQVLGIGVDVGVEDWRLFSDVGKTLIKRENIEKAVKKLMMDGGDEIKKMRIKIKGLREKAIGAVKAGGSSHQNLTALIDELKQLQHKRLSIID